MLLLRKLPGEIFTSLKNLFYENEDYLMNITPVTILSMIKNTIRLITIPSALFVLQKLFSDKKALYLFF